MGMSSLGFSYSTHCAGLLLLSSLVMLSSLLSTGGATTTGAGAGAAGLATTGTGGGAGLAFFSTTFFGSTAAAVVVGGVRAVPFVSLFELGSCGFSPEGCSILDIMCDPPTSRIHFFVTKDEVKTTAVFLYAELYFIKTEVIFLCIQKEYFLIIRDCNY